MEFNPINQEGVYSTLYPFHGVSPPWFLRGGVSIEGVASCSVNNRRWSDVDSWTAGGKRWSVRWRGRKGQYGLHPLARCQLSRSFCPPTSPSSTFTSFWRLCPWLRCLLVSFSPLSRSLFLSLRFTYPFLHPSCTSSPLIPVPESSPPGRTHQTLPPLRCHDVSWL